MIGKPKRAVTRFFIPLIDVLILLFCIFLLMPFVEVSAVGGARLTAGEAERLQMRIRQLEERLAQLEKNPESKEELVQKIQDLEEKAKRNPVDALIFRTMYIDENNGALFYNHLVDGVLTRITLKDEARAEKLMSDDRKRLQGTDRKLVYLIVRPQNASDYPTKRQRREYHGWFVNRAELRWTDQSPEQLGGMNP